ncbi:MAG: hypothetical protein ACOY9J_13125 [Pseudomonadota bacterium]
MRPAFSPWTLLLLCTLLAVQLLQTPLHMHLCLDAGQQESAIHLSGTDHAGESGHHVAGDQEIELKTQDDTRPATPFDNPLPALLAAFVFLLLLPQSSQTIPSPVTTIARPSRAWRLLPPAHAPPAHS